MANKHPTQADAAEKYDQLVLQPELVIRESTCEHRGL